MSRFWRFITSPRFSYVDNLIIIVFSAIIYGVSRYVVLTW